MSFKICDYNMGTDTGDYNFFRRWKNGDDAFGAEMEKLDFDEQNSNNYMNAQNQMTESLTAEPAEVYLLQEVCNIDRPLINKLKDIGYQIFHLGKNDTAIALKAERFSNPMLNILAKAMEIVLP